MVEHERLPPKRLTMPTMKSGVLLVLLSGLLQMQLLVWQEAEAGSGPHIGKLITRHFAGLIY